MNGKWLKSFMEVYEIGSVNKAAEAMFISQQALLQQINLLEEEVGVPLFTRTSRGMVPTIAGREFYVGTRNILNSYETTLTRCRLASEAEHKVRIPMMNTIILPELMEKACKIFDHENSEGLRTEFIFDLEFDNWLLGLMSFKYDIIEFFTLDGMCPPNIHFDFLESVQTWCIMSAYHPLAQLDELFLEDISGYTLLTPRANEKLSGYIRLYIENSGLNVPIEVVGNNRYEILAGLNRGSIYSANENIAHTFPGYLAKPLNFDTHVQHGFACRQDSYETYRTFFDAVHRIADGQA